MLPEFRVPITLGGETHALLVEDVPACVFWQGYPDTTSEASDRDKRQREAEWLRHLLVRVTLKPALTVEWVTEMADDAWPPTHRYLEAIGFFPRPVVEAAQPGDLVTLDAQPKIARGRLAEHAAFRGCVPPPHVQGIVRLMARAIGVPASQLWLMFASEFFFCYHVNLSDEEKHGAPLPEVSR
jgi:hypothetical protein